MTATNRHANAHPLEKPGASLTASIPSVFVNKESSISIIIGGTDDSVAIAG